MDDFGASYVLAGFDGPPASVRALRWAAKEARLRRLPMLVCHAWRPPYPPAVPGAPYPRAVRDAAQRILETGLFIAREAAPYTIVRGLLKVGPALDVLANLSCDASLAVIGGHESTSFTRESRSPAIRLPEYAHCPVIVVRKVAEPRGPIVVGVDGSASSEAALEFAYLEAALRERPIRVVYACGECRTPGGAGTDIDADAEWARTTASTLERLTSPWREKFPAVRFEESLVTRSPQDVLFEAAEDAGLLVVGGRGLGDVRGFRLGPVSGAMVRGAPCSVAVVRPRG